MNQKAKQNSKYLKYKKSFQGETRSIFHHFGRAINEAINKKFVGRWKPEARNFIKKETLS